MNPGWADLRKPGCLKIEISPLHCASVEMTKGGLCPDNCRC
jgi:hypothetical protein